MKRVRVADAIVQRQMGLCRSRQREPRNAGRNSLAQRAALELRHLSIRVP